MATDELTGRRLVVTGASAGIGAAVARGAIERGARVAGVARRTERLREIPGLVPAPADLRDPAAVDGAIGHALDELGGLDDVVCAAGINVPGLIADTSFDDWSAMLTTNVLGVLNVVKSALPHLAAGKDSTIVVISSNAAHHVASPQNGVYSASKAAVSSIADALRLELAGVARVAEIAPAYVRDTEIHREYRDPDHKREADARQRRNGMTLDHFSGLVLDVLGQPSDIEIRALHVSKPGYVLQPYRR